MSISVFILLFALFGGLQSDFFRSWIYLLILLIVLLIRKKRAENYISEITILDSELNIKYFNKNEELEIKGDYKLIKLELEEIKAMHKGNYVLKIFIGNKLEVNQFQIGEWDYKLMSDSVSLYNKLKQTQ